MANSAVLRPRRTSEELARHQAGDHSGCDPARPGHGICSECGKTVATTWSSAPPERRRCRECQRAKPVGLSMFTCANADCGREFSRRLSATANDHPCCSHSCSSKVAIQRGLMPNSVQRVKGVTRDAARKARCRARLLRHAQTWDGIPDEEILDRDGWRCQIPGCKRRPIRADAKYPHPRSKSIDHIVPLSLGGDDTAVNKRAAHLGCNVTRSNKMGFEQAALFGVIREPPLMTRTASGKRKIPKRRRSCECEGKRHECFERIYSLTCTVCDGLFISRTSRRPTCSDECRAKRRAIIARRANDRLGEARGWPRGKGAYNVGREAWNKGQHDASAAGHALAMTG